MFDSIIGAQMTVTAFLICEVAALVMGLVTAFVFNYKSHRSGSMMLALAVLPAVVSLVIMMVNGNIGAGLAVAGAFALVRFRSAPGNAKDITGLFFAMAIGLACGMGYVGLGLIFLIIIGGFVLVLSQLGFGERKITRRKLKITIPEDIDFEGIFDDLLEQYTKSAELLKVKTTNMGTLYELSYEVELKDAREIKAFIDALRCRNGNLPISCSREVDSEVL